MIQILLMVCPLAVAQGDCQPNTAIDLITGPIVRNEISCGVVGQAFLAETALIPQGGEYLKIKCVRTK